MHKNVKYLQTEIKHFVEMSGKKFGDKSDNWLLAKKPVGSFTCASCENYIGDLQDNSQFVPWNKVPQRDPSERLYRIGNGFSRMLQLINVETSQNKSKDSDGDMINDIVKLPRVKSNRNRKNKQNDYSNNEIVTDYVKTDANMVTTDNGFKPKV